MKKIRDEVERVLNISDITATDLKDDLISSMNIEEYRAKVSKTIKNDEYMRILAVFNSSIFQDFESFLRTEIHLVEDDIRLVLDQYNSGFITFELKSDFYTFKDLSEVLFTILQPEYELFNNSVVIEFDDITMKTKMVVRSGNIDIGFEEKSFFSTILGVSTHIGILNIIMFTLARKMYT